MSEPLGSTEAAVLRGRVQEHSLDARPLIVTFMTSLIASGAIILFVVGLGEPSGSFETLAMWIAIGIGVVTLALIFAWQRTGSELAIHDDRLVVRIAKSRPSDAGLVVLYGDVQRLALDKGWIRLHQKNGRRLHFKGSRLQVEDGFDLIAKGVERANPHCQIQDRPGR